APCVIGALKPTHRRQIDRQHIEGNARQLDSCWHDPAAGANRNSLCGAHAGCRWLARMSPATPRLSAAAMSDRTGGEGEAIGPGATAWSAADLGPGCRPHLGRATASGVFRATDQIVAEQPRES